MSLLDASVGIVYYLLLTHNFTDLLVHAVCHY
jgi:hypothetical protein